MEKNKLSKYEAICFILISIITEIILNVSQNYYGIDASQIVPSRFEIMIYTHT